MPRAKDCSGKPALFAPTGRKHTSTERLKRSLDIDQGKVTLHRVSNGTRANTGQRPTEQQCSMCSGLGERVLTSLAGTLGHASACRTISGEAETSPAQRPTVPTLPHLGEG